MLWRRSYDVPPPRDRARLRVLAGRRPALRRRPRRRAPSASRTCSTAPCRTGTSDVVPRPARRARPCSSPRTATRCARSSSTSTASPTRTSPASTSRPASRCVYELDEEPSCRPSTGGTLPRPRRRGGRDRRGRQPGSLTQAQHAPAQNGVATSPRGGGHTCWSCGPAGPAGGARSCQALVPCCVGCPAAAALPAASGRGGRAAALLGEVAGDEVHHAAGDRDAVVAEPLVEAADERDVDGLLRGAVPVDAENSDWNVSWCSSSSRSSSRSMLLATSRSRVVSSVVVRRATRVAASCISAKVPRRSGGIACCGKRPRATWAMCRARSPMRSSEALMRSARDDDPQVGRDRLLLGEQQHAALVEVALELVDPAVVGDDGLGELQVGREQRDAGAADRGLDQPAHRRPGRRRSAGARLRRSHACRPSRGVMDHGPKRRCVAKTTGERVASRR